MKIPRKLKKKFRKLILSKLSPYEWKLKNISDVRVTPDYRHADKVPTIGRLSVTAHRLS